MKLVTILFLRREGEILLAMKKAGFGAGKWNGVGGKAEPGETAAEAAIRECQEEVGVTPLNPKLVGRLKFYDTDDPTFGHHAHIFVAGRWQGEPVESAEMRPQWFKLSAIPYEQMWVEDRAWLPLVLEGKLFEGTATMDLTGNKKASHDIAVVTALTEN